SRSRSCPRRTRSLELLALGEERDEVVELLRRERRAAVLRHHAGREALLDVGIRVGDRLANEVREGLVRRLRVVGQLVEVGADLACRGGGRERVTGCTARRGEDGLAGGRVAAFCRRRTRRRRLAHLATGGSRSLGPLLLLGEDEDRRQHRREERDAEEEVPAKPIPREA